MKPRVIILWLTGVILLLGLIGQTGKPFSGQQVRVQTAHLICCNLLISVPGNWIGASRDCENYVNRASPEVRADICKQLGSAGLVCAATAAYCNPKEEKPPADKCDEKKACEIVRAMLDLIARYSAPGGFDPGSFSRFMSEFNPLLQKLSEALACRFNEGADAPVNAARLKELLGKITRDKNYFQTVTDRSEFPKTSACVDRTLGEPVRPSLAAACADYDRVQRIRQNLEQLSSVLGCPVAPTAAAKSECQELSNSVLDGLSTLFDEFDKLKSGTRFGSGDAYDQVTGGLDAALKELESTAETIEGQGGTGAQQYKDIQGRIAKLKELLDVWNRMKAASCLPPEILQLLRRLAEEKRAGHEHKATCTELCGATADWYVKISGLAAQRGTFFKACTLACF